MPVGDSVLKDLLKQAVPKSRLPILLIIIGAIAIYLIGRWDNGISEAQRQHQANVSQALEAGKRYRILQDSLRIHIEQLDARDSSLSADLTRSRQRVQELVRSSAEALDTAQIGPLHSLLPPLKLVQVAPNIFRTDSLGVRHLAILRVEAERGTLLVPQLQGQIAILSNRVSVMQERIDLTDQGLEAAELRVVELEDLLEEGQRLSQCKIMGLISCPSRTASFLGGVGITLLAVIAVP